jgi:uncharacterized tellurite resistance protein B-like protein
MLKAIRRALGAVQEGHPPVPAQERRQLELAVAVLVHEARRADYAEGERESAAGVAALMDIFALARPQASELLAHGRERAAQLNSFYAPVSVVKREYSMEERVRLVEHLWRVSFADGKLDYYEDHYVRKIAHLLHVPNTDSMLARNRARA